MMIAIAEHGEIANTVYDEIAIAKIDKMAIANSKT
jgi:hypothetical protein